MKCKRNRHRYKKQILNHKTNEITTYDLKINNCDFTVKCTGPNEYFACGGACDNVCETLDKQNQTNCPIRNIKCNPMCYCNEGYARNDKQICVPIEQCPGN